MLEEIEFGYPDPRGVSVLTGVFGRQGVILT
jgi:hypothetical protein